ncbi:hybrid signal transduction histidine kinase M [Tanacetum coccineum]
MAVEDTPPPPPPSTTDKIIPFSIPNKVPIKLDLEKHNYNSWSSFSLIHLGSLGLKSHVETDTASTNPEWCQLDDLIKMWILGSLCDSLQEQVVTTPGNAKALWDRLKELFHDNKDARAINLDNELRSIKIGKMTVNEYCTKIRSMADRLINLGCVVSDKNLVIYTINGLDSRFATLVEIIRNRETFPSFENVRTMLLLKESSFNNDSGSSTDFSSSSSSPTVLLASNQSNNKGNPNKPSNLPQLCNHFNKGTCKFGDRCKYIHDHRNRSGLNNKSSRNFGDRATVYSSQLNRNMHWASQPPSGYHSTRLAQYNQQGLPSQPNNQHTPFSYGVVQQPAQPVLFAAHQPHGYGTAQQQQQPVQQQHNLHSLPSNSQGILGAAPALHPSQATSLPSAFSTMTLHDPTWNMDTGATSHLNSNAHNLSTLFNSRLYPSIHVGDGNSIPVTNTGHSIIPSLHRPLHLHNVLVTPNIIKNLIYVRQFTRDNNCTIEFDAFGFSVKDFLTRIYLTRHMPPSCEMFRAISIQLPSLQPFVLLLFPLVPLLGTNASVIPGMMSFRSLYGHKQAPCAWFQRFAGYATRAGFSPSRCDSSLFIYTQGSQVAYLLIYVDEIILTASSSVILWQIIDSLHKELGCPQKKYALQLLKRAHMVNCNPSRTPIDTDSKLGPDGVPFPDLSLYAVNRGAACFAIAKRGHVFRILPVVYLIFKYADIFTKGLPLALFEEFRLQLERRPPPAQTSGRISHIFLDNSR